jgi:hypothetical protein
MAIELDILQTQYGVSFAGAYLRIVNVHIVRRGNINFRFGVVIDLSVYAKNPQGESIREIEMRRYNCSLDEIEIQSGDNFLARCYEWIMAQPDMVGAIAV